ncbi:MAG: inositol monophosphatase [Planctomycetales bacterium]|nr:inositol monophosphatase [Planctomycetales bacterium]
MTYSELLEIACEAARRGGAELMSWRGKFTPKEKGPRDLVSEADLASQDAIESFIRKECPTHEFLGEEDPQLSLLQTADTLWVVDPLDGTTNYVHSLNAFAVSIALVAGGQIQVGVIYDPVSEECFCASRGAGAELRDRHGRQRLQVSQCREMEQSLIAASFPTRVQPGSEVETRFLTVLRSCQAVRRIGAAALNLAYLAAGRLDGYWATSVKAWDVAAGFLLVEEAGGRVTHLTGDKFDLLDPKFVAASTPQLHATLSDILGT